MRTITVERGYDPREFTLVPFGGMGPTIAGRIVAELGIGRILIPRDPGAFSAYGMLVTDVHQERSLTRITRLDDAERRRSWTRSLPAMEEEALGGSAAGAIPARAAARRCATPACATAASPTRSACRWRSCATPPISPRWRERFHEAHRRRYGHMAQNEAVEIVNFQVTAVGAIPKPQSKRFATPGASRRRCRTRRAGPISTRPTRLEVPVFRRSALAPGRGHRRPRCHRGADLDHRALSRPARAKSTATSTSPSPLRQMHDRRRFAASKRAAGCG